MLRLAGESEKQAADDSDRVWRIESALAKASMGRKERRDPIALYHRLSRAEHQEQARHKPGKPGEAALRKGRSQCQAQEEGHAESVVINRSGHPGCHPR